MKLLFLVFFRFSAFVFFSLVSSMVCAGIEDCKKAVRESIDFSAIEANCIPLAQMGNGEAQWLLGSSYKKKDSPWHNPELSIQWFLKAAGHEDKQIAAAAARSLTHTYALGIGVPEDAKEAVRWRKFVDEKMRVNCSFKFGNGDGSYVGQCRGDKVPDGVGVMTWSSGGRYEGGFLYGKRTGKGIYDNGKGFRYEGDFVDGKFSGNGRWVNKDGERYEGGLVDDERSGKGIMYYKDGGRYEGGLVDGERSGKGIMYYKDGGRYEGNFERDFIVGEGVTVWSDGRRYEGRFLAGKKVGEGVFVENNGVRYEGEFRDDQKNGFGKLMTPKLLGSSKGGLKAKLVNDYYVEQGMFENGLLVRSCESKADCRQQEIREELAEKKRQEDKERLDCSTEFGKAATVSDYERFIQNCERLAQVDLLKKARNSIRALYDRQRNECASSFKKLKAVGDYNDFVSRCDGVQGVGDLVGKAKKELNILVALEKLKEEERKYSFEQGDTVYVIGSSFTNGKYYWLRAGVEAFNRGNGRVKVSVEKVCWRTIYNDVICNRDDGGQPYRIGNTYWVDKYDASRSVP